MTYEKYLESRAMLDDLNYRIDRAPITAKPVFRGIVALHDRVHRYERKHGLAVSSNPNG